jgi:hypothetical protein
MREAGSALAGAEAREAETEGAEPSWAKAGAHSGPARQAAASATGRQMGKVLAGGRRFGRCGGVVRRFKEVLTVTGRVAVGLRQRLPSG